MCGITGFWSIHSHGEGVIRAMTLAIRHRGPDEQRWTSPAENLWLGHARLKVIDLTSTGAQPMQRAGRGDTLVFNGEIYNYRELRAELEASGETFLGSSDSEVLLAAYQVWGRECVHRLQGMFSLAIWDEARKSLFLARDRAGKKPLYLLRRPGLFAFGSEPKALLVHPEVTGQIRGAAMPSLTMFGYPETGQSAYEEIGQIRPGSWALFRQEDGSWQEEVYWKPRWRRTTRSPTFAEAARETRRLLERAVQKRLVADVPLGAFLSGGLDSTIVTGLMSKIVGRGKVRTFSIGFADEPAFDESAFAQQAADFHGTRHTLFRVEPPPFSLVEKLVDLHDAPFADSSAIPTYLVAEMARRHVTVVLTGDGGDEVFAGYPRMAAAVFTEAIPPLFRWAGSRLLRSVSHFSGSGNHARSRRDYLRRMGEALGRPLPERFLCWISVWADPGQILSGAPGNLSHAEVAPEVARLWEETRGSELLGRILEINFREYLGNDLLVKVDRCTMAHGLEARCPFLDQDLFAFCASLPASFHLRGLTGKKLLRAACSDLLPPTIQTRGKMGFGIPLGAWFRGRWRSGLEDRLRDPDSAIYRFIQFERARKILDEHLSSSRDHGHKLWLLLTLSIWLGGNRAVYRPKNS